MKKQEKKRFWTNKEVETLLQMAAEELQKEFYTALKTSSNGKNIKIKSTIPFDPKLIIKKANEAKK